jgi:hypothetical protein
MPTSIHTYQKYLNPSGDPVPLIFHFMLDRDQNTEGKKDAVPAPQKKN